MKTSKELFNICGIPFDDEEDKVLELDEDAGDVDDVFDYNSYDLPP